MDCSNTKTREIIIKKYNKIQEQGESFIQTKIIQLKELLYTMNALNFGLPTSKTAMVAAFLSKEIR